MEKKEYSAGYKLCYAVVHQLFLIMMVVGIFYLGRTSRPEVPGQSVQTNSNALVIAIIIVGLVGSLLILAYLTLICGKRNSIDREIKLEPIDKLPSDVMLVLFLVLFLIISQAIIEINKLQFQTAGLMVTVGTITYLIDVPFLFAYLSFVRRIKGETIVKNSLLYITNRQLRLITREKKWTIQYLINHILGILIGSLCIILIAKKNFYEMIAVLVALIIWDLYSQMKHATDQQRIRDAIESISGGEFDTKLRVEEFTGQEQEIAGALNSIQKGMKSAVEESIKNERMKADLITNVSHDIKTPLTSIINYVELLKREEIENENAKKYIRIIEEKSNRLKQLTEDLVEASRISAGNIKIELNRIDLVELLYQTGGEFNERFEARNLTIVSKFPQTPVYIMADGRQLYRSIENLYINASKYAMENTRVYVELTVENGNAIFTIKNISQKPVTDGTGGTRDLTERFVRGEESRTTEGSGLGLSIAKNLINLMGGSFEVRADGDIFLATMSFSLDL